MNSYVDYDYELDLMELNITEKQIKFVDYILEQFDLFFEVVNTFQRKEKCTKIIYKNVPTGRKIKNNSFFSFCWPTVDEYVKKEVGKKEIHELKDMTSKEVLANGVSSLRWSNNIINQMIEHNIGKEDIIKLIKKLSDKFIDGTHLNYYSMTPEKYKDYTEFNYKLLPDPKLYEAYTAKYIRNAKRGWIEFSNLKSLLSVVTTLYKKIVKHYLKEKVISFDDFFVNDETKGISGNIEFYGQLKACLGQETFMKVFRESKLDKKILFNDTFLRTAMVNFEKNKELRKIIKEYPIQNLLSLLRVNNLRLQKRRKENMNIILEEIAKNSTKEEFKAFFELNIKNNKKFTGYFDEFEVLEYRKDGKDGVLALLNQQSLTKKNLKAEYRRQIISMCLE